MKNCTEVRNLISLYIDDELSKAELEEFNEHINSCSHCRAELEEIKTIVRLCRDIDEVELPANFKLELHEKLVEIKIKRIKETGLSGLGISILRYFRRLRPVFC